MGIARATQWVYLSTIKEKELSEMGYLHEAEKKGHLILQRTYDFNQKSSEMPQSQDSEDEFSLL